MRRKGVECREGSRLHDWTSGWQGQWMVRRRKPRRRRRDDCKLREFFIQLVLVGWDEFMVNSKANGRWQTDQCEAGV